MKKSIIPVLTAFLPVFLILSGACRHDAPYAVQGKGARSVIIPPEPGEKIYCTATLEDKFHDQHVIIVLNKETNFEPYSVDKFPELGISDCVELTAGMVQLIQQQLEAEKTGNWEPLKRHIELSLLMNTETFRRILRLTLIEKGKSNVLKAVELLSGRGDVLYAGVDYYASGGAAPNPLPDYWGEQELYLNRIYAQQAWEIETGSSNPTMVCVIDSGIEETHPDLSGRVDIGMSRDFQSDPINGTPGPGPWGITDPSGHGTGVAALISSNGNGMIGVNWGATLVSYRVLNENGGTYWSLVISAIDHAAAAAIPVLNISIYGGGYATDLFYAIQNFSGLIICCAGNNNQNINTYFYSPAGFDMDNLITVGAIGGAYGYLKESKSNYSTSYWGVELFAPGENVLSAFPLARCLDPTIINGKKMCEYYPGGSPLNSNDTIHIADGYHYQTGSSFAAPLVTGAVLLLKAKYPLMQVPELKALIVENVSPQYDLRYYCTSGGSLNIAKALNTDNLFAYGSGTQYDPYQIWNEHHLRNIPWVDGSNIHYQVVNDIYLPYDPCSSGEWEPLPQLLGTLDGINRTISNLFMWGSGGLFINNKGTIKNLHLNGHIVVMSDYTWTGMFASYNSGIIEDCTSSYTYLGSNMIYNPYPNSYTGGIAAFNYPGGIIRRCTNYGNIYSVGGRNGIAVVNYGTITSCNSYGQLLP